MNFIFKVAIGDFNGTLKVYYGNSFTSTTTLQAHTDAIWRIKQSPFKNYVATGSYDNTTKIWDPSNNTNWQAIRSYRGHSNVVPGIEFLSDGDRIATGSYDQTIQIWSISTGQTQRIIYTDAGVVSLKLLGNGIYLACGFRNGYIQIYNLNTGAIFTNLTGHSSNVRDLVLISNNNSPNGLLASSSQDTTVRIWDLNTYTIKFVLSGHTDIVYGLRQINTDILCSGSYDKTIKVWSISSGQLLRTLTGHSGEVYWSIDMLTDGNQTLVSGAYDSTVKMWNVQTGHCLNTIYTGLYFYSLAVVNTQICIFFRLFIKTLYNTTVVWYICT